MFGGVHELSIDSKGRLAIPAKFRDLLARHYTPSLVVTVEARTHLVMYPEAEWQKTAENLQAMNVSGNPGARMFRDLMIWMLQAEFYCHRACAAACSLIKK